MTADTLQKTLRYRWFIFWILALCYVLVYFHRLCPAVVAVDMMRDLKVGGALTGLLGAAYFYPYALMQLPAGLLSDSWGPINSITLFFLVAFAGSIILGLAPNVSIAIVGRTLVGVGVAMLFVPTMKILAEWFRVREFALMTGLLMAMGGIGSLTAATPLVWLSSLIGWRMSFVVVGIITLVLGLMVWVFVRDRPSDFGWPPPEERSQASAPIVGLRDGVAMVLKNPYFWPLAIWFFFDCGVFFSFGGLWGGPFLMQVYGLEKEAAGRILSMLAIGMIIGSPALSYLSNNIFRARKPVIVMSAGMVVGITGLLAFYTDGIPITGLYLICLGLGIFSSAIVVIGFTATKELYPVQIAGTSIGLVNLFPFSGGAIFQHLLGWVLDTRGKVGDAFTLAGYRSAFQVLFVSGLIAFISSLLIKETMVRAEDS